MDISAGIEASLGGRYASALFELARDGRTVEQVENSLGTLRTAVADVPELRRLIGSPLVSRAQAERAVAAVSGQLQLDPLTTRFLGVLAANRRLRELPAVIRAFRQLAARYRGETTAEVTSAHPLADDQVTELKHQLRQRLGREVQVQLGVDPDLLGGLVVRVGSQMIDSSIRTRLAGLANAMKG